MNPVAKALWLSALRSGEYPQTRGALHRISSTSTPVGWCCYGVLCDVAIRNGVPVVREADSLVEYFDSGTDYLPLRVQRWAGLPSHDPLAGGQRLSERNDAGSTLAEIADLIEEHL